MKKVYICAPLSGDVEGNLEKAKRYSEYALRCGAAPVTPHFYALCLNDNVPEEREMGMAAWLSLLWFCDEVWVFGDQATDGMRAEIKLAHNLNIKVKIIKEHEIKKVIGDVTA